VGKKSVTWVSYVAFRLTSLDLARHSEKIQDEWIFSSDAAILRVRSSYFCHFPFVYVAIFVQGELLTLKTLVSFISYTIAI
jgi:hypothetical protein